ncbi:MAG: hypothetical protein DI551_07405 [Micavibrio aeruginosavorus]|uniref:Uncharacterized protein n=1 Tax=Micavibrio aeruginosavorus TaxID=349221 RepID=A0A2W5PSM7_9BACT|nr:MAG: hypothetical protein DI551_07405 [Micavibrio aeruginosavorus]
MRSFDPRHGYDTGGAYERMVAMVQDIKASPATGKSRLVIREKGKSLTHAVIDIDMKVAKDIKTKETYQFSVREKDDSRNPGFQRQRAATFKAYSCEEKPEDYVPGMEHQEVFSRFTGGDRMKNAKRIKF